MRLLRLRLYTRTEDGGSEGCPPEAVGCTTDPDGHDLTPQEISSISQVMAASSTEALAHATSTPQIDVAGDEGTPQTHVVNGQIIGGIIIIFIVLASLSAAGMYVVFGGKGQNCCCARRRRLKDERRQLEEACTNSAQTLIKETSNTRLVEPS